MWMDLKPLTNKEWLHNESLMLRVLHDLRMFENRTGDEGCDNLFSHSIHSRHTLAYQLDRLPFSNSSGLYTALNPRENNI